MTTTESFFGFRCVSDLSPTCLGLSIFAHLVWWLKPFIFHGIEPEI